MMQVLEPRAASTSDEHERRSIWRADVGKAEASGLDLRVTLGQRPGSLRG